MPIDDNLTHKLPTLRDVGGAAEFLSVSDRTVQRLLARHALPYSRVGSQIRISEEDLLSYIQQQRVPAAS